MCQLPVIRGRHLRYLLVVILDGTRTVMTIPQLVEAVAMVGFSLPGAPGKAVSDSLRWAVGHEHVRRVGHGRYVTAGITRQTRHRFRKRIAALQASAQVPERGAFQ